MGKADYVIRLLASPLDIEADVWNQLLARQSQPTPFMRHEYLAALHLSGSATPATGWTPCFITLWQADTLAAACPLYLKTHSYGEYVFDWSWASAYRRHGLAYYPKAVVAVPFTPVAGSRLLARDEADRMALMSALLATCEQQKVSSLHLLFASAQDLATCQQAGLSLRHTVQFHWHNSATPYLDFEDFLRQLSQEKRKKNPPGTAQGQGCGGHTPSSSCWRDFTGCLGFFLPLLQPDLCRAWQRTLSEQGFFSATYGTAHDRSLAHDRCRARKSPNRLQSDWR